MTYPLSAIIGYDCEVSVPNGHAVHGYILARWMDQAQERFDEWLAEHDRQVAERAWADGVHFANNSADTFCACEGNPYRKETT